MKKILVCILSVALFSSLLIFSASADSSVTVSGFDNILSWTLVDDPDDSIESVRVQFRAYGTSTWVTLDEIPPQDFNSVTSYIIPDSLLVQGNYFRVAIDTATTTHYSNGYGIVSRPFDDFALSYDYDSGYFSYTPSSSSVILHFQYLGTSVNPDFIQPDITLPAYSSSYFYLYGVHTWLNGSTYVSVPLHDCLVYATTTINGVTYTSNSIRLFGSTTQITVPEDTEIYDPLVNDVSNMVTTLYGGVTHTPVYKYVFSALGLCLPVIAAAFVVKKFVL